jgi:hypothetical protein
MKKFKEKSVYLKITENGRNIELKKFKDLSFKIFINHCSENCIENCFG